MPNARPGDPILSPDGNTIVAYWRRGLSSLGWWTISFGLKTGKLSISPDLADAEEQFPPEIRIRAVYTAPDRTYWQVSSNAPDGWQDNSDDFVRAPIDPGPDPKGMVAAYDLVVGDLGARTDPMLMHMLTYQMDMWDGRATRKR